VIMTAQTPKEMQEQVLSIDLTIAHLETDISNLRVARAELQLALADLLPSPSDDV